MSARPITVIACDIGGVVKNHLTDEPIEDSIESVVRLYEDTSNQFIFISKCRDHYQEKTTSWLQKYNLSHIKTYYCLEYVEKVKIASDNGVNVMIDDRMQVLRNFPATVIKIWFCSDPKKIEGARKFQPDFVDSVRIARNWQEIIDLIEEIKEAGN
jgi:uncharacterized HAD superfamily protein